MTKLMTCLVRCESALQSVAMAANQLGWDDHIVLEVKVIREEKDVLEVELWGDKDGD
jgi:hypothetical protein